VAAPFNLAYTRVRGKCPVGFRYNKTTTKTNNRRRNKMSKSMKHAYRFLRIKDMLSAIAPIIFDVAFVIAAFALVALNTELFKCVAIVAVVVAAVYLLVKLAMAVCSRSIGYLGFSEVELEQLGWA